MADILKFLRRTKDAVVPEPQPVKAVGYHAGPRTQDMIMPWTRYDQRRKLEDDLINMDKNGGLFARMLDKTADYATCWDNEDGLPLGVKILTAETDGKDPSAVQKKAVDICNEFMDRVGLNDLFCWNLHRAMVHKGDVFTETVLDENLHVEAVLPFSRSWQINKNVDEHGNLKTGSPEIALKDPKMADSAAYTQVNEIGKVIAAFYPHQISHWSFGAKFGELYAEPVGASAIKGWKRLEAGMDSLGVARVIRAWDTNIHIIPMPAGLTADEVAQKVDEYQNGSERDEITTYDATGGNFQSTPRFSPTDVSRDIYMPMFYTSEGKTIPGDVRKLMPSTAALQHTEDIQLGLSLLICAMNMPIEILGLDVGSKPMVDKTKEEGMEAWAKYIRRLQASHATGLKALLDLELLMSGVNPMQPLYRIVYPPVSTHTAEADASINMSNSQAALYKSQMMIPPELIGKSLGYNTAEVAMWRANVEKTLAAQKAAQTKTNPAVPAKQLPKPKGN